MFHSAALSRAKGERDRQGYVLYVTGGSKQKGKKWRRRTDGAMMGREDSSEVGIAKGSRTRRERQWEVDDGMRGDAGSRGRRVLAGARQQEGGGSPVEGSETGSALERGEKGQTLSRAG